MAVSTATRLIHHYIDGAGVEDPAQRYGEVYDPARGAVQARVALADPAMVDRAVRVQASRRVSAGRFHFSSTVLRIDVWS